MLSPDYTRGDGQSSISYDDVTYHGYKSTDDICLDSDGAICLQDMNFYEATYASENSNEGFLSDVAMIVGLSRKTDST